VCCQRDRNTEREVSRGRSSEREAEPGCNPTLGSLSEAKDQNGEESETNNRAMATNFEAFKTRLRQLGFFTDLADASNSQVIEPRFRIIDGKLEGDSSAA